MKWSRFKVPIKVEQIMNTYSQTLYKVKKQKVAVIK